MNRFLLIIALLTTSLLSAGERALLFSGSTNPDLAQAVTKDLGLELGKIELGRFNDGEISIKVLENVRGRNVYLLQSLCTTDEQSVNDSVMELYLLVRTLRRSSAANVTAIIPYFGYARQDRKNTSRVPISASDLAMLLETAGVDRVVAVDLHCGQIQGFFHDTPVDNLEGSKMMVPYLAHKGLKDLMVVSPDAGGVDRAKQFMAKLTREGVESNLAIIVKQRARAGVVDKMNLVGTVEGSDVVIVDDLCDTGGTLVKAAAMLKEAGARRVFAAITHPVFSGKALENIGSSVIEEMVITDTIPLKEGPIPANIKQVSVSPMLAEVIRRLETGESISSLF